MKGLLHQQVSNTGDDPDNQQDAKAGQPALGSCDMTLRRCQEYIHHEHIACCVRRAAEPKSTVYSELCSMYSSQAKYKIYII